MRLCNVLESRVVHKRMRVGASQRRIGVRTWRASLFTTRADHAVCRMCNLEPRRGRGGNFANDFDFYAIDVRTPHLEAKISFKLALEDSGTYSEH